MAEQGNNSTSSSTLIRWVLGIIVSSLVLVSAGFIAKMDKQDTRLVVNEIAIAKLTENTTHLTKISESLILDQLDKVYKAGELNTKLSNLELKFNLLEDRYKTISERLLAINARMDSRTRDNPPQ